MNVIHEVHLSKAAGKQLSRVPRYIVLKLMGWIDEVEQRGLQEVRKIPGFHDEPLKGQRQGQRSIRLSRSYRAIYVFKHDGVVEFVEIQEVSKHEY